jgi:hypothetical protein
VVVLLLVWFWIEVVRGLMVDDAVIRRRRMVNFAQETRIVVAKSRFDSSTGRQQFLSILDCRRIGRFDVTP